LSVELFRANRGLLHKFARRYARIDTAVGIDDLMQAGYMGLVEAERTFDASKGKSWAGWAAFYIRRRCGRPWGSIRRGSALTFTLYRWTRR